MGAVDSKKQKALHTQLQKLANVLTSFDKEISDGIKKLSTWLAEDSAGGLSSLRTALKNALEHRPEDSNAATTQTDLDADSVRQFFEAQDLHEKEITDATTVANSIKTGEAAESLVAEFVCTYKFNPGLFWDKFSGGDECHRMIQINEALNQFSSSGSNIARRILSKALHDEVEKETRRVQGFGQQPPSSGQTYRDLALANVYYGQSQQKPAQHTLASSEKWATLECGVMIGFEHPHWTIWRGISIRAVAAVNAYLRFEGSMTEYQKASDVIRSIQSSFGSKKRKEGEITSSERLNKAQCPQTRLRPSSGRSQNAVSGPPPFSASQAPNMQPDNLHPNSGKTSLNARDTASLGQPDAQSITNVVFDNTEANSRPTRFTPRNRPTLTSTGNAFGLGPSATAVAPVTRDSTGVVAAPDAESQEFSRIQSPPTGQFAQSNSRTQQQQAYMQTHQAVNPSTENSFNSLTTTAAENSIRVASETPSPDSEDPRPHLNSGASFIESSASRHQHTPVRNLNESDFRAVETLTELRSHLPQVPVSNMHPGFYPVDSNQVPALRNHEMNGQYSDDQSYTQTGDTSCFFFFNPYGFARSAPCGTAFGEQSYTQTGDTSCFFNPYGSARYAPYGTALGEQSYTQTGDTSCFFNPYGSARSAPYDTAFGEQPYTQTGDTSCFFNPHSFARSEVYTTLGEQYMQTSDTSVF